jgi:hypothetical protein
MSFGDTFWKVWEVRTSVRIQESIEDYFSRKPHFDNTSEIVNALVRNQQSWEQKINNSRQRTSNTIRTIPCEYCGNRFTLYSVKDGLNHFTGIIFFDNTAYRANEEVIIKVTNNLQSDPSFHPLFYCCKKCTLDDKSVVVNQFL